MAGAGFHSVVVPRMATIKSLNLRADCQGVIPVEANCGTLDSGLQRVYSCCGKPRYNCELFAKWL
jgi:hypothetical protein